MNLNSGRLVSSLFSTVKQAAASLSIVRTKWVDHRMIRDVKRRKMNCEAAPMRLRLVSLKRNNILPVEIREMAAAEIHAFPKNSTPFRMNRRCVITSRPRGIVDRYRMSRIIFRHLADYNKLAGMQRALW